MQTDHQQQQKSQTQSTWDDLQWRPRTAAAAAVVVLWLVVHDRALLVKGTEKKNLETPSSMHGPMSCPSSSCTTGFTDVIFRYTV